MPEYFTTKPQAAKLTGLVQSIWNYQGNMPYEYEQVLPGVISQLLINLHEDELRHWSEPGRKLRSIGSVGAQGVLTAPILIDTLQKRNICGVAFTSFGLSAFSGIGASQFTDTIIDASEFWGTAALDLRSDLLKREDSAERCQIIEDFLVDRLADHNDEIELVKEILSAISSGGKITDIRKHMGLSQRALHTLFDNRIGVQPKTYARVKRFSAVLGSLTDKELLADLAYSHGFSDQAHLTREFRTFAGKSPTQHSPVANENNHARLD